jgi:alkylation response protein AidB-like acyl-CoA dehydrogenase
MTQSNSMALRHTVDFLLYDWLATQGLTQRERFADHSRETFDAVLGHLRAHCPGKIRAFQPHGRHPRTCFDGEKVILPACTQDAHDAYVQSGMLSAAQDFDIGGMQLPYTVEAAANAFFACASVSIGGGMLTVGNANLLMAHGSELQKQVFALNEFNGRFAGTMCLSEPQAGSSLSDVATRATPDGDDHAKTPWGPATASRATKCGFPLATMS